MSPLHIKELREEMKTLVNKKYYTATILTSIKLVKNVAQDAIIMNLMCINIVIIFLTIIIVEKTFISLYYYDHG